MLNHAQPLSDVSALLVEDEAFIAMAISDVLENAGASLVEHAFTLEEANQVLEDTDYQVAILDLRLPDGSSSGLARKLIGRGTPIIFHSGHAEVEKLQLDFPMARICHKPCRWTDFVDAIQDLLDR